MAPPGVVWQKTLNATSLPSYSFPLKNLYESRTMNSFYFQSLLLLELYLQIPKIMPAMIAIDFVFLSPARHFMEEYCPICIWTWETCLMYHSLLSDRSYYFITMWVSFFDFWAFCSFCFNLHSEIRLGCVCFTWSLIHVACDTNELAYRKKYNGLLAFPFILLILIPQLAKKIREKFNRYLDVVNRNKQVVEASYTAHLTAPLTAIQDCCTIPPSMME